MLSSAYLKSLEENQKNKYASADKIVDASTCLYPDTTWFIKDMTHNCFPMVTDVLLVRLCADKDMTVWDDEAYPQYLVYAGEEDNGDTLTPLTDENTGEEHEDKDFVFTFEAYIKALLSLLKTYIFDRFNFDIFENTEGFAAVITGETTAAA